MDDFYGEWQNFIAQEIEASFEKKFEKIQLKDRTDVFSESIKTHNKLWNKPTYNEGEVWAFYGGGSECFFEILDKTNEQVLCKRVYTCGGRTDGLWNVFDIYGDHGYANCGTPEMRIRIR